MIADYKRGPGPRAGYLGRLKSPHVLNLISSIKLKNKTFFLDEIPSHDQTDGSLIQFQATEQMSQ
jgi:hypothetical protein